MIFGPSVSDAIVALRKVAIDFPEVCIMDTEIATAQDVPGSGFGSLDTLESIQSFFSGAKTISEERYENILSKSGKSLGTHDFFFEWFQKPSVAQVEELIVKIDEALVPTKARYTMTTK